VEIPEGYSKYHQEKHGNQVNNRPHCQIFTKKFMAHYKQLDNGGKSSRNYLRSSGTSLAEHIHASLLGRK
jgi:hypothetical protein